MAFTQADRDKLAAAIVSGTLRVRYADHEVTYQTAESMLKALALVDMELEAQSGDTSAASQRCSRMTFNRG